MDHQHNKPSNLWQRATGPMEVTVGKQLPVEKAHRKREQCRAFWQLSYDGGPEYKNGKDCDGEDVFVAHEAEGDVSAKRRKRLSAYRNYCRPIVDRYVNLVYSTGGVARDTMDPDFAAFVDDADTLGTHLHDMMREASLMASVRGEHWIVVDSDREAQEDITVADARASGVRLFAMSVEAWRVPHAWVEGKTVREALVFFPNEAGPNGERTYRLYREQDVLLIVVGKTGVVSSVQEMPNDFGRVQAVRVLARDDSRSLISDIAELNKSVYNLDAIHREELVRQTFTSWLVTGVNPKHLEQAMAGGRKIWCVNRPGPAGVEVNKLSADVQQAESLREAIRADVAEIYRLAGLSKPEILAPESGVALKIRFEEIENQARMIADLAETAEWSVTKLWLAGRGRPEDAVEMPMYPEDFLPEDVQSGIEQIRSMRDAGFPATVVAKAIERVAREMFDLTDSEAAEIAREMVGPDRGPEDNSEQEIDDE